MINNSSTQKWNRLDKKNLDSQFLQQVKQGCNCSTFEAKAILETVHEVYEPYFNNASTIKPGQIQIPVISVEAPPNMAIDEAKLVNVILTLFDNSSDLKIRKKHGVPSLRRHRIQRVCIEAFQQGAVLTVEDLCYRIFNCGYRTVCRDIKFFKDNGIVLPLRSNIKDMGRTLSHRKLIVQQWLTGDEYYAISKKTFHSVESVSNYIGKFKRVALLTTQNFDVNSISFLVNISSALVSEYQNLMQTPDIQKHRKEEVFNLNKKKSNS